VSGSYDKTVGVWDIISGEKKWTLAGHSAKVYNVVYDHVRNQCYSGSMDGTIRIWSLADGQALHSLVGHSSLVGLLSLSSTSLVSGSADGGMHVWDPTTGQLLSSPVTQHLDAVTCLQHDDTKILSGAGRKLTMWDAKTGTKVKDLLENVTGVWAVTFNDRICAAAANNGGDQTRIHIWDYGWEEDGSTPDISNSDGEEEYVESDDEDTML
jgi:F-box and WD-40 domain protein CDC4